MIVLKNISKSFKGNLIFKNLNCSFEKNKFTGIIGVSGIGKTSLLRILMGLDDDYTGEILNYDFEDISVVFQENRLLENFSIEENINLVLAKKIDPDLLKFHLQALGLNLDLDKKVSTLSGGMKRRLAILRAILLDKSTYILDEPFKDMDLATHLKVLNFVGENLKGKTVIFTSHNLEDIRHLGANILSLDKNKG